MRIPSVCLSVCLLTAGLIAQDQAPPVFRSRTDLVQLDVSVLDKKRRPVRGLKVSDFQLVEDGKPQELSVLSEIDLPDEFAVAPVWARAAPPDVSSNEVGDKRLFAIMVDVPMGAVRQSATMTPRGVVRPNTNTDLVDAVSDIVHGIIDRMGPRDMVAIVGTVCNQAFTDDREKLNNAIDSIRPGAPPCRKTFGFGADRALGSLSIRELTEYLAVVPQRRKAIIYIGGGSRLAASSSNPRAREDIAQTVFRAQQSNVNIYTISPFVIRAFGGRNRQGSFGFADNLKMLPEETGGFSLMDPLKYEAALDQLFIENGSYYMLGYRSSFAANDGKFRRLSIKVAGRSDVTVRTRSSWYHPKASETAGPVTAAKLSNGTTLRLMGLLPDLDVTFDAVAMPFAKPGGGLPGVALVTELTEPVAQGTTRITQQMDLRMLIYDDTGEVRKDVTIRAPIDAPPTTDDRLRYAVMAPIDLAPGRYAIRLVAHNGRTDKLGSNEFDLTIPNFARDAISLSGVAITIPERAPMTTFGDVAGLMPVTPTAQRGFTTSERAIAYLQVYQGGTTPIVPVEVRAQVLDARGTPVLDVTEAIGPERFSEFRAAEIRIPLPLDKLHAGAYLLTIEGALGARRTPRRDVRFIIR